MTLSFMYPWAFLLLLLLILLGVFMGLRKRPSITVSNIKPFAEACRKKRSRLMFSEICVLAAAAAAVTALARPRTPAEGSTLVRQQGVDIILALDMSASMAAFDRPKAVGNREFAEMISRNEIVSRLESAKREIRKFISKRPNDRIGLIGFADMAYSFVPPTLDHAVLLERLKELSPGDLGNATGIASPIGKGAGQLKDSAAPRRILVLFSDGENTADNRISPQAAAEAAKTLDVIIHCVGIGSDNCCMLTDSGMLVPAENSLDEKLLKEIASISTGQYFHAADSDGMQRVMTEIDALEKTSHEEPKPLVFREYSPVLAILAALLLLAAILSESTGKMHLP